MAHKKVSVGRGHRSRLREYFFHGYDSSEYSPFHRRSNWIPPPNRDMALQTYIKGLKKGIEKELHQRSRKVHHDNLMKDERGALFSLKTPTDIIIKKADEGSATVVM